MLFDETQTSNKTKQNNSIIVAWHCAWLSHNNCWVSCDKWGVKTLKSHFLIWPFGRQENQRREDVQLCGHILKYQKRFSHLSLRLNLYLTQSRQIKPQSCTHPYWMCTLTTQRLTVQTLLFKHILWGSAAQLLCFIHVPGLLLALRQYQTLRAWRDTSHDKAEGTQKDLKLGNVLEPMNVSIGAFCESCGSVYYDKRHRVYLLWIQEKYLKVVWMTFQYVSVHWVPAVVMKSSWGDSLRATPMWNKHLTQPGFAWRHDLPCFESTGSPGVS